LDRKRLYSEICKKSSFLCVGLDSDLTKIPPHLHKHPSPVLSFNKRIIDATKDHCVAYKINTAFYEQMGSEGWDIMKETLSYIPDHIFKIADAKRGDIGNTANMYAKAFFETMNFDAITLSPYMGKDSVEPYLKYKNKWVILLALTSNKGSADFQLLDCQGKPLYEKIIEISSKWGTTDQIMYVVGGTHPDYLKKIRSIIPDHFLLVPGIGAQGGDTDAVLKAGINDMGGILINSSRGIIYADNGKEFDKKSMESAKELNKVFKNYLQ